MARDTFIITVHCLVVEFYHQGVGGARLRSHGFAPELTDEEVITAFVGKVKSGSHTQIRRCSFDLSSGL